MPRRPTLLQSEIKALLASGLKPKAIEIAGVRYIFDEIVKAGTDDLDAELERFEARHGKG